jgi:phage/plasmid-like protein (TIGR03299 family)
MAGVGIRLVADSCGIERCRSINTQTRKEIIMTANVETMFYRQETPWHGLGTRVEDYLNSADAIKAAELDWTVSKRETHFENNNGEQIMIPDHYAIVRDSDESVLGTVGKVWEPLQNTEAFDFTDALLTEGCDTLDPLALDGECPRYETAGSLKNGQMIWLLAKMPIEIRIQGEDAVDMFLLFSNGHDGKHAVQAAITPVRVVCQNTLNLAMATTKQKFSIRHSSQMKDKIEAARLALGMTFAYAHEFEDMANRLAEIDVTLDGFKRLATHLSPSEDIQNRIVEKWQTSNTLTDEQRKTGWGAVNAVGEYFQWGRNPYKGAESRFANDMFGDSAVARDKAVRLLLAR